MATASAILEDIQIRFGDTASDFISATRGLEWLDQAQKEFSWQLQPLKRIKQESVSANQDRFTIPDEAILMDAVSEVKSIRRTLKRVSPGEFRQQQTLVQNAIGDPIIWTEMDDAIYVWPRFSGASKTGTLASAASAASTILFMNSTSNFRSYGRVKINSEEIEYTGKDATSITGLTRGRGGTTDASHATDDTVTQLDFEMIYSRHPDTLSTQTDELEIKEVFHKPLLQHYVLYLAYLAEGSRDKASDEYRLWQEGLEKAKDIEKRRHLAGPLTVKDIEWQRVSGLYGPSV